MHEPGPLDPAPGRATPAAGATSRPGAPSEDLGRCLLQVGVGLVAAGSVASLAPTQRRRVAGISEATWSMGDTMRTNDWPNQAGDERCYGGGPSEGALPGKTCRHCWSFAPGRGDCTGECLYDATFHPAAKPTSDAVFLP